MRRIQQRVIHSVSGIVEVELVLLAVRISCASMGELSRRYNEVGNNDLCQVMMFSSKCCDKSVSR